MNYEMMVCDIRRINLQILFKQLLDIILECPFNEDLSVSRIKLRREKKSERQKKGFA
jgi:hypothetical protein